MDDVFSPYDADPRAVSGPGCSRTPGAPPPGWSHLTEPRERGESIGMPPAATFVLGAVELGASILLVVGLWDQAAAAALVVTMLGALYKKIFVWKTGFWGDESTGWYYELLYLVCNLVIVTTGGGAIGL